MVNDILIKTQNITPGDDNPFKEMDKMKNRDDIVSGVLKKIGTNVEDDIVYADTDIMSMEQTKDYHCPVEVSGKTYYLNSAKIRAEIVRSMETIAKQYIKMGKLLFHVELGGLYRMWGYNTLKEWADEDLGLTIRTVDYLTSVYVKLIKQYGIKEKELTNIGWGKAKEIVRLTNKKKLDKDKTKEWLEVAKNNTTTKFNELVKRAIKDDDFKTEDIQKNIDEIRIKKYMFDVIGQENLDITERAMELARNISSTGKNPDAFTIMSTVFLSHNLPQNDINAFYMIIATLENQFGLEIEVKRTGEVIYPIYEETGNNETVIES